MENLGHGSQVACEVSLCALGDAAAAPGNEDELGQARIGVLDLDERELDPALAEVLNQVGEFAIYRESNH